MRKAKINTVSECKMTFNKQMKETMQIYQWQDNDMVAVRMGKKCIWFIA